VQRKEDVAVQLQFQCIIIIEKSNYLKVATTTSYLDSVRVVLRRFLGVLCRYLIGATTEVGGKWLVSEHKKCSNTLKLTVLVLACFHMGSKLWLL
jgi:hypothetical protein